MVMNGRDRVSRYGWLAGASAVLSVLACYGTLAASPEVGAKRQAGSQFGRVAEPQRIKGHCHVEA